MVVDIFQKSFPGLVDLSPHAPNNLLVVSGGALGDWGYAVPALNVLRSQYNEIWAACREKGRQALGSTGLIDEFIIIPEGYNKLSEEEQKQWYLAEYTAKTPEFRVEVTMDNCLINRFTFKRDNDNFKKPTSWKRAANSGKNWFDEISKWLGVPIAVGDRPVTKTTHQERRWLRDFRFAHKIPIDAFLLGWQFMGSGETKWYPHFREVIQEGIMSRYEDVYVVGLGDLSGRLNWTTGHNGRFINLADSVSFRQAYILTEKLDLLVGPDTGIMVFSQGYPNTPKVLLASLTGGGHLKCGNETTIVSSDAKCAPCWDIISKCQHDGKERWQYCMGQIKPEKVIKSIESVLWKWRRKQRKIIQIGG